jgi:hypothetical protein
MAIRVVTLRRLSQTRRHLYRVRWRFVLGEPAAPTDGREGEPLTWARWEEDYYTSAKLARDAIRKDPWATKKRPPGVMDQVPAWMLWEQKLRNGTGLDDYAGGLLTVLYSMEGAPGLLACDR